MDKETFLEHFRLKLQKPSPNEVDRLRKMFEIMLINKGMSKAEWLKQKGWEGDHSSSLLSNVLAGRSTNKELLMDIIHDLWD